MLRIVVVWQVTCLHYRRILLLSDSEGSRQADNTAGEAGTSVAGGGGELVAADTKVVDVLVADHGPSDAGVGSVEHH